MPSTPPQPRKSRLAIAELVGSTLGMVLVLASMGAWAQAGTTGCGNPFVNHFGPFDYRTASPQTRKLVEDFHFTLGVETLTKPATTMFSRMAQDIAYTLHVFPNHPRALISMEKAAQRFRRDPPPGTEISVECWFDRALRFRPDDTVARSLYARFLMRRQQPDRARMQIEEAARRTGDNPFSVYNVGLVAFEIGHLELALQQAHKAKAMGFPRLELQAALEKAGRWVTPAGSVSPAASAGGGGS
jgi:hypothetical protein